MLVEVAFKGNRKEFFHWNGDEPLPVKAAVIVEADRGEDLGFVYATGELAEKRVVAVAHKPTEEEPVSREVRRLATPDELKRVAELREQDEIARRKAIERVKANSLVMKLTDAEWRWDRRKLTIYFTADKRVDFRNLVRELAAMFRTRIELKQIGVRDEAKRLGGIGRCGREYCSASWLPELRPVNLGVAKDQRLSLNPTQISGACGRLMCCLRYEHDFYVQQRKRFPKEGKIIETSKGEEKVISNDIFRERVTLRAADGELRIIPLAELRRAWKNPPAGTQGLDEEPTPFPYDSVPEEVLRLQDTSEMPAWRPGIDPALPRGLPVFPGETPDGGAPRSGRSERGERGERSERSDRGNRDRGERSERSGRPPRSEGGERGRSEERGDRERRGSGDGSRDQSRDPSRGRSAAREQPSDATREQARDASRAQGRERPGRDARPPIQRDVPPPAARIESGDDEDGPDEDESPADATSGEQPDARSGEERRMRRRRGRRGGRRSRGGGREPNSDPGPGDGA